MHCDELFLNCIILNKKTNIYGGDVQLHFFEEYQKPVHTISSRNGTVISGVFNKITNQTTLWNGPRYRLIFSTCEIIYNNFNWTSKVPWQCYEESGSPNITNDQNIVVAYDEKSFDDSLQYRTSSTLLTYGINLHQKWERFLLMSSLAQSSQSSIIDHVYRMLYLIIHNNLLFLC